MVTGLVQLWRAESIPAQVEGANILHSVLGSPFESFAETLKSKFSLPGAASPEDQLKGPVADLIAQVGAGFGLKIQSRTETHLAEQKVRPDMAVYSGGLICGYIELKAPGLGADAPKLKGKHNKEQWEKLKVLPNLMYTDGREWALYRGGERKGAVIRFSDDPTDQGKSAVTNENASRLSVVFQDFLSWLPAVPHKPTELAKYLAPLSRFLRSEVEAALESPGSNIEALATEWRNYFFPTADNAQFADAYAQTVSYAMLLARLSGATKLEPHEAAKTLDQGNRLLARALELLGQEGALDELRVGFELLQRSLEALDPFVFLKSKPDLWLYFYEDFLAAYDPKLRNDYGVYYTPREVVELQVRVASELLEKRFSKKLGFADEGVVFLDPAVGTGTYPVAAVKHSLEKVRQRSGDGAIPARAEQMALNMYGFEILVGPYAVAHLRLSQTLEGAGAKIPGRIKIYLADTLESPNATPPGGLSLTYKALTQEHEAARKLKNEGEILVCLGNPPYDRQQIDQGDTLTHRKGGWVRFGDQIKGGAKQQEQGERPILADFTEPASAAGQGVHIKNIYNDYVYFWRWALWRLFEQQKCGGIITFITASSYLAGPGFVGMREVMRRTFDELWILDLGGDNLGTRKTPNVFNIQTPVAIAIGVRGNTSAPDTPANVFYGRISGQTREAKLQHLDAISGIGSVSWQACQTDWHAPFLPTGKGDYFNWPKLIDLMPLALNGAQFKRHWPIGETEAVLTERWKALISAKPDDRAKLFRETSGWKTTKTVKGDLPGANQPSVFAATSSTKQPQAIRYGYRAYDRHFALYDFRLGDRLRPPLFHGYGPKQIYLTTLLTNALAQGQALVATSLIPDLHHFRGSFGGKDVLPLYRDAEGEEPNVTAGLLEVLGACYGSQPSAERLACYIYALLGGQSYTKRFWNELETPGARVPITKDLKLFDAAADLGARLIWLHTYAERLRSEDRGDEVPVGLAKNIKPISSKPNDYPETFSYDEADKAICVGPGRFGPVEPAVWEFEVSGLNVVQSWLAYRMKKRAGKKSSALDDIRPDHWTPKMTDEFLELLWVVEETLSVEPELSGVVDKVVAGGCFQSSELPVPTDEQREPPGLISLAGDLLQMMEEDDDVDLSD